MGAPECDIAQAGGFIAPPGYHRHRPEATLLYQLVAEHYPAFRDRRAAEGRPLPRYVEDEFEAYLKCGRLVEGFLRVKCDSCQAEKSCPAPEAARRARRILAVMMTSGLYDGAGEFAYRVGLPAKSGVGGGILAIAPNTASIAVWSPGLNESGNSLLGTRALQMLTDKLDWSSFGRVESR